ncbi:MAG: aspartate ammonia-lyase [Phototrophicaceae bacterium]
MTDYRTEKDSLGEIRVPKDALYAAQTQRAVENFPISGMKPYPAFIWSMAVIKRAAAEVHKDLGLLEAEIADAIIKASDEVISGIHNHHFVVDPFQAGAGTSHHMNVNEVISNRANQILGYEIEDASKPVHPNDHVNMAQSTNDTIPTAIRLGVLWRYQELQNTLSHFVSVTREKATAWDDVVKTGRTHLQDAVPVRLGQEIGAWAKAIERQQEKVEFAAKGLRRLGIGGTAAGTGLNAHPEYHSRMVTKLSELTGFELYESDDLFESMQSMQDPVFFSAALRNVAMDFTRISNDVRLLTAGPTTGIAELTAPTVQPGSSIMPGKVNPVLAEMLNQSMYHVMGNDTAINMSGAAGQFELNVMMPIISHNLNEMMQVMIGSITAFTDKLIAGLILNRERTESWLSRNPILVTALNPIIGYNNGAKVAKKALAEGKSVREVVLELGLMTEEDLVTALDAYAMTEGGIAE